jgi:hypothetical protein
MSNILKKSELERQERIELKAYLDALKKKLVIKTIETDCPLPHVEP